MTTSQKIARALLEIGAIGFVVEKPITFKSGIISPVYIDNRRFPFFPKAWKHVIDGFCELLTQEEISFDVIAGIETAGIPHSASLGLSLGKPSVFVRKKVKDHGTKKMIEGGNVKGKRVLLIEDHVTTGLSSLAGVTSLRDEGAIVTDCLAITSYEFAEADDAFAKARVKLHTLTSFAVIFKEALRQGKITKEEVKIVQKWLGNPHEWGKENGYEKY